MIFSAIVMQYLFLQVSSDMVSFRHHGTPDERLDTNNISTLYIPDNTTVLSIQYTEISCLPARGFSHLPLLEGLYLVHNRIGYIHKDALIGIHRLKGINLSYNPIRYLKSSTFRELNELQYIEMVSSLTGLEFPSHLLVGLDNLVQMNLMYGDLSNLHVDTFSNHSNLVNLFLKGNLISFLHKDSFIGLPKLRRLHLGKNHLTQVEPAIFRELHSLQKLEIYLNRLVELKNGTFVGLKSLIFLRLESNLLVSLESGVFNDLENIETIYLSYNKLKELPSGLFSNTTKLQKIFLEFNELIDLPSRLFQDLPFLNEVYLGNNELISIPFELFLNSPNLKVLDLKRNELQIVEEIELSHWYVEINLGENPLQCVSKICWLLYNIKNYKHVIPWTNLDSDVPGVSDQIVRSATCASPDNLAGKFIRELELADIAGCEGL